MAARAYWQGQIRRELATHYLANTDRQVTAIAGLVGYASLRSFTRWFTAAFGVSPQAWRLKRAEESAGPPPIWRR
jgi:AraC-like DNA-binding protein